mgnify:CR=1 FL=1
MARLGNYPIDRTLSRTDKFLGTNADGTTRNFTVNGVREFFSQDSSAGASDELNYKFKSTTTNTVGIMSTSGNTDFNSISTIKIHEKANGLDFSISSFFSLFAVPRFLFMVSLFSFLVYLFSLLVYLFVFPVYL